MVNRVIGVLAGGVLVGALGVGVTAPGVAAAQGCAPVAVTRLAPAVPILDWAENLGIDADGRLWVSRNLTGRVERYDRAGEVTAVVEVPSPGAVRLGPDGWMYVTTGNSPTGLLPGAASGAVLRFDPTAQQPTPTVVIDGLGMPNGMAIAGDGTIFVADSSRGLLRIHPDGSLDEPWTAAAPHNLSPQPQVNGVSLNGLALSGDGRDLYVTITGSPTGRILRVPVADPAHPEVLTDLLSSAGTAIPDDLVVAADGALLVGTTTGRIVRVDPATGAGCTVYTGEPVTALAIDPSTPHRAHATTLSGALLVLDGA